MIETHAALHERFPSADVTIATALRYDGSGSSGECMQFSIRSWVNRVDAGKLAVAWGGGGTKTAAGGRVHVPAPFSAATLMDSIARPLA